MSWLLDRLAPQCIHCEKRTLGGPDRCPECWRLQSIDPEIYEKYTVYKDGGRVD